MTATSPIRFDNVTLGYDHHPAVHHLTGTLAPGSLTAIVGPNGAGKSTLLKGIVGTLKPLDGRIDRGDVPRRRIAYLPQAAEIVLYASGSATVAMSKPRVLLKLVMPSE